MLHKIHQTQWTKKYATLYEYSTLKVKKTSVIFIVRVRFTKSYSRIFYLEPIASTSINRRSRNDR